MTGSATIAKGSCPRACLRLCKFLRQYADATCHEAREHSDADSAIEARRSQTWCFAFSSAIGCVAALATGCHSRPRRSQPLRIVVLGDSLVAGFGLKASDAFPGAAGARPEGARPRRGGDQCRRFGRYDGRRAGTAALGGAGADRRGDPGARRQRCAARARPGQAKANLDKIDHGARRRAAPRCCSPACSRRATWARTTRGPSTRIYPELATKHGLILYPFFLDGVALDRASSISTTACIPTAKRRRRDHQEDPAHGRAADRARARKQRRSHEGLDACRGCSRRSRYRSAIRTHLSLMRAPLAGAKWIEPENMHITLRFAGDIDGRTADEFAEPAGRRFAPSHSTVSIQGVGRLRRPRPARAVGGRGGGRAARRALPRPRAGGTRRRAWSPSRATSSRT